MGGDLRTLTRTRMFILPVQTLRLPNFVLRDVENRPERVCPPVRFKSAANVSKEDTCIVETGQPARRFLR